jgi:hypothetical protein
MNLITRIGGALGLLLVVGCSNVGFRQVGTVQQLLPDREAPQYAWRFSFNGTDTLVYPIVANGPRVLFANRDGLRLHWDGETIYLIEGLSGAFGTYRSGVEGNERWYDRDGAKTYRLTCSPKRDWQVTANQRGSRQECRGEADGVAVMARHTVELNATGSIRTIEATLLPRMAPAKLTRLSP